MKRKSVIKIHLISTVTAGLTIFSFFTATIISEVVNDTQLILTVKEKILYALPILLISMPSVGISGVKLTGRYKSPLHVTKLKRMKIIAFNGILLILLAIYLYVNSRDGVFGRLFWAAQTLELMLGAANLFLIARNIRAGFILKGRYRERVIKKQ
ncbi:MAG: hypothetical protein MI975_08525 [Cytophagales bacterium]|nr:hypothetical protein [Cytophagales bacterium]